MCTKIAVPVSAVLPRRGRPTAVPMQSARLFRCWASSQTNAHPRDVLLRGMPRAPGRRNHRKGNHPASAHCRRYCSYQRYTTVACFTVLAKVQLELRLELTFIIIAIIIPVAAAAALQ